MQNKRTASQVRNEGSDLWETWPQIGGKKGGEQDCLAEKERSRENDSNFKSNGRASNEELKRATESIKAVESGGWEHA